ncbi:hypothetical protein ALNOE001_17310 [Candidatus Methanobinarius endosymbioticus]|uniref:SAP domain-containing protein n=1 Tax=Candidatus Methanobinarius endosymbioticus TaxID=2006182 RepID=A0A366M8L6_9EURY|nr:hypothetical protein ALNOE001_17310 [Candidatus Methanobinarius endosymbioticus]
MNLPKDKTELYETYYLKKDLMNMCKEYELPTTGSKDDLLKYLANFIENKPIEKSLTNQNEPKKHSNYNDSSIFIPSLEKKLLIKIILTMRSIENFLKKK